MRTAHGDGERDLHGKHPRYPLRVACCMRRRRQPVREGLGFAWDGSYNIAQFYMVHFRSQAKDLLQNFGVAWHYQSPSGGTVDRAGTMKRSGHCIASS